MVFAVQIFCEGFGFARVVIDGFVLQTKRIGTSLSRRSFKSSRSKKNPL
jgi:hypothetical protein